MGTWSLDDIPWDSFDAPRVNAEIVPIVKAASMVEFNADDYRVYLQNVFGDDLRACRALEQWSIEEIQHGKALGRWAELADPDFNFDRSFERFVGTFNIPLDVTESVRGSQVGELVAHCMVETGTSSFYSALAEATNEPVLNEICRRIAEDEIAHYHLFYSYMRRYLKDQKLPLRERFRIAFERTAETEDDELARAYWAANRPNEPFERRSNSVAYAQATLKYYKPRHVARAVEMIFGTLGLNPSGPLGWVAVRAVRMFIWYRTRFAPWAAIWASRLTGAEAGGVGRAGPP
ncbi:MAG: ferritin-like domain-containing protein [Alphaproteobacteria bacterium]|jgi:rubrerythrin|nr:ferritin-like domain-containing protein [Alphaproteobacteria bacterium]